MNRSPTLPPESSSRWAGQEVLKESFGKKAERHDLLHEMAPYLETNLMHPHSVVLCSPQSSARATIRSKNLLVRLRESLGQVSSADFDRIGMYSYLDRAALSLL